MSTHGPPSRRAPDFRNPRSASTRRSPPGYHPRLVRSGRKTLDRAAAKQRNVLTRFGGVVRQVARDLANLSGADLTNVGDGSEPAMLRPHRKTTLRNEAPRQNDVCVKAAAARPDFEHKGILGQERRARPARRTPPRLRFRTRAARRSWRGGASGAQELREVVPRSAEFSHAHRSFAASVRERQETDDLAALEGATHSPFEKLARPAPLGGLAARARPRTTREREGHLTGQARKNKARALAAPLPRPRQRLAQPPRTTWGVWRRRAFK